MGVCRLRTRRLITPAVWMPSMPGIWTSIRIIAKSPSRSLRSASSPEVARTRSWPSGDRIASSAIRFGA